MKGILALFEEEKSYVRDMSKFYNPKIQNVSVTVEGKPNQGMRSFEQYDKICKYFAEGVQRDNDVQKQLELHDLSLGEYLTDKYALWLDFRKKMRTSYTGWVGEEKMHPKASPCRSRRKQKQLGLSVLTST